MGTNGFFHNLTLNGSGAFVLLLTSIKFPSKASGASSRFLLAGNKSNALRDNEPSVLHIIVRMRAAGHTGTNKTIVQTVIAGTVEYINSRAIVKRSNRSSITRCNSLNAV
jgi:hypothetical protein